MPSKKTVQELAEELRDRLPEWSPIKQNARILREAPVDSREFNLALDSAAALGPSLELVVMWMESATSLDQEDSAESWIGRAKAIHGRLARDVVDSCLMFDEVQDPGEKR